MSSFILIVFFSQNTTLERSKEFYINFLITIAIFFVWFLVLCLFRCRIWQFRHSFLFFLLLRFTRMNTWWRRESLCFGPNRSVIVRLIHPRQPLLWGVYKWRNIINWNSFLLTCWQQRRRNVYLFIWEQWTVIAMRTRV